jgi:hypothetical protein
VAAQGGEEGRTTWQHGVVSRARVGSRGGWPSVAAHLIVEPELPHVRAHPAHRAVGTRIPLAPGEESCEMVMREGGVVSEEEGPEMVRFDGIVCQHRPSAAPRWR